MNIVKDLTDTIIDALEAIQNGERTAAPWAQPWSSKSGDVARGMPFNGATGRPYHGGNIMILWLSGYADARWYTYKQAMEAGTPVRKGQKGTHVIFWQPFKKKKEDGKEETGILMRTYVVFNHEQLSHEVSQEEDAGETSKERTEESKSEIDAGFVANLNLRGGLDHRGSKAMYVPSIDQIVMPPAMSFTDARHYVHTLAHECAHATGAEHRLNRAFGKRFGDSAYAVEEMVAEMAAAFVSAHLGIEGPELQHVEYLAHWVKVLKTERNALLTIAKQAEAAYRMVLGLDKKDEVSGSEDAASNEAEAEASI